MAYRVEIFSRARKDIGAIEALSGSEWFSDFEVAVLSLRVMPRRCSVVTNLSRTGREIRRLLVGKGHHIYWVYFSISGQLVKVLHVRHVMRKPLSRL